MLTDSLTGPSPIIYIKNGDDSVEYRKIGGFKNYAVGDDGSVWSKKQKNWRKLAFAIHKTQGYLIVSLIRTDGIKRATFYVHTLVLTSFIGLCPEGMEARHYPDRDPANCKLENLSWDTPEQNAADRVTHGTQIYGKRCRTTKLTEKQVKKIVKRLKLGESQTVIANNFNVTSSTIYYIATGRSWSWLTKIPK